MNRYCALAVIVALSSVAPAAFADPLVFQAPAPTLTSPTPNQAFPATFHAPGHSYYANIPVTTSSQFVQVAGGQPGQVVGVSWLMDITVGSAGGGQQTISNSQGVLQQDSSSQYPNSYDGIALVKLDSTGTFKQYAMGAAPGSLSGTVNGGGPMPPGVSVAVNAHSEITYSQDSKQGDTHDTPGSYHVTQ